MQQPNDILVIAQGGLAQLREIQGILAQRSLSAQILQPPTGQCGS
jgi:hypothetical protein